MTVREALQFGNEELSGITPQALADAELLLTSLVEKDRSWLLAHPEETLSSRVQKQFAKLIERRSKCEPIAYILGKQPFYGRDFSVDKNVLIPRPETEIVVDQMKEDYSIKQPLVVADIGTGSGVLAVTIALEFPFSYIYAIDLSKEALGVAQRNAREYSVQNIEFHQANLLDYNAENYFPCHVIVANLPYLTKDTIQSSPTVEELSFEPIEALVSEEEGLALIKQTIEQADCVLRNDGTLYLEMDPHQIPIVLKWLSEKQMPYVHRVHKDLKGLDRILSLKKEQPL